MEETRAARVTVKLQLLSHGVMAYTVELRARAGEKIECTRRASNPTDPYFTVPVRLRGARGNILARSNGQNGSKCKITIRHLHFLHLQHDMHTENVKFDPKHTNSIMSNTVLTVNSFLQKRRITVHGW